jgi:hypothetical protein
LDETEKKNSSKLNKAIQRYKDLKVQSADFDQGELAAARLKIRPEKQLSAENKLQSSYGKNFSIRSLFTAIHETDRTLNDCNRSTTTPSPKTQALGKTPRA